MKDKMGRAVWHILRGKDTSKEFWWGTYRE